VVDTMKIELKENRNILNVGDVIVCNDDSVYMIGRHTVIMSVYKIDLATGGVISYNTLKELEEYLRECGITYRIIPSNKIILKEI
jgi:hypothetical protein